MEGPIWGQILGCGHGKMLEAVIEAQVADDVKVQLVVLYVAFVAIIVLHPQCIKIIVHTHYIRFKANFVNKDVVFPGVTLQR